MPAGSELIFQVHYTPIGTPQQDHSMLGLLLADPAEVTHEVVTTSAVQTRFRIPPGEPNHEVLATSPRFPPGASLLSFSPHMHVRGKSYRYELQSPGGDMQTLLDIPAYDFNWQTTYVLSQPRSMQAGSRLFCTAIFDNSEANLNNPDPTRLVTWGDQTWDEMMIGYYHYSVPVRDATGDTKRRDKDSARLRKFDKLDTDGDGKLNRANTPRSLIPVFNELDRNDDNVLTREEVVAGN